eukprot:2769839-Prymnesium_polylepis.1
MAPREGTKAPGISPCPFGSRCERIAGLNAPLPRPSGGQGQGARAGPGILQRCSGRGDFDVRKPLRRVALPIPVPEDGKYGVF